MSYCRWSSMNWMCDLYCYEDVSGGFTTHIAGRKRAYPPPDDRLMDMVNGKISGEEWVKLHRATMDALESIPLIDLDLPHAGETFNDPDLESFKARLLYLRGLGYRFPDGVLETIDEEMKERDDPDPDYDDQGNLRPGIDHKRD